MTSRVLISSIIGLLLIALGVYFYLKTNNIGKFDTQNDYYTEVPNVSGLAKGVVVEYKGLVIGKIVDIQFKNAKTLRVRCKVHKKYNIPKEAIFAIRSGGAMTGNYFDVEYPKPCAGEDCAKEGHLFKSRMVNTLENIFGKDPLASEIGLSKEDAYTMLDTIQETYLGDNSPFSTAISKRNIEEIEKRFTQLETEFNTFTQKAQKRYKDVETNLNTISQAANRQTISQIQSDFKTISKKIDKAQQHKVQAHSQSTQEKIKQLQQKIQQQSQAAQNTSTTAKTTFSMLDSLNQKISSSEGSMPYLLEKEGFQRDWNNMMQEIDSLTYNMKYKKYYFVPFASRKKTLKKHPDK